MTQPDRPHRPLTGLFAATGLALGAGAATLAFKGWPPYWPGLLLPLSLSVFCFVFVWGLLRRPRPRLGLIAALVFGALCAHLVLWTPFFFASYLGGYGGTGAGFSLWAAGLTGAVVGWYILTDHLWVTLAGVACLAVFSARIRALSGEERPWCR